MTTKGYSILLLPVLVIAILVSIMKIKREPKGNVLDNLTPLQDAKDVPSS